MPVGSTRGVLAGCRGGGGVDDLIDAGTLKAVCGVAAPLCRPLAAAGCADDDDAAAGSAGVARGAGSAPTIFSIGSRVSSQTPSADEGIVTSRVIVSKPTIFTVTVQPVGEPGNR